MEVRAITASDKELLAVILNKCQYFGKTYITPSQKTLLGWYNQTSRRNICIRTLNYMLRRLDKGFYIERIQRQWKDVAHHFWFRSTLYRWSLRGSIALERFGTKAYKIIKDIKELMGVKKSKRSKERKKAVKPDRSGKFHPGMKGLTDRIKTF